MQDAFMQEDHMRRLLLRQARVHGKKDGQFLSALCCLWEREQGAIHKWHQQWEWMEANSWPKGKRLHAYHIWHWQGGWDQNSQKFRWCHLCLARLRKWKQDDNGPDPPWQKSFPNVDDGCNSLNAWVLPQKLLQWHSPFWVPFLPAPNLLKWYMCCMTVLTKGYAYPLVN